MGIHMYVGIYTQILINRQTQISYHDETEKICSRFEIFQKYPILEVTEYDQNGSFYKKACTIKIFARITSFSSIIYYFKFCICTVPGT